MPPSSTACPATRGSTPVPLHGYGEITSVDRDPRTGATWVGATSARAVRYPWGEEHTTESITHEARNDEPWAVSVTGEFGATVRLKDRTLRWKSRLRWSSGLSCLSATEPQESALWGLLDTLYE